MDKKILKKLIALNTISSHSNLDLIRYATSLLRDLNFQVKVTREGLKANLFAYRNTRTPKIILASHTDTVPPCPGWQSSPFALKEKSGKLFGLGVADMKSQIAISLGIAKNSDVRNLAILLTFDEETDFSGAKLVGARDIRKDDFVIIGEPTGGKAVLATKGVAAYDICLTGKTGHGSEPDKGISAILAVADFIREVNREFSRLARENTGDEFKIPRPTINFGEIEGGDAINKIAYQCRLSLELRYTTTGQFNAFRQILQAATDKSQARIQVKLAANIKPFRSSMEALKIIRRAKIAKEKGVSYTTEASIYGHLSKNIIIFGPGSIASAHKPNESINQQGISRYESKLLKLIRKM